MSEETLLDSADSAEAITPNFRDGLSEEYKDKYVEFQDANALFKGYDSLVSKMGQNPIVKPKDDATDEAKAEYTASLRKELGAPDSKDAYDIKFAEDLPEGFVNDHLVDSMKDVFLKHGVSPDAAQEIVNNYFGKQLESFNAANVTAEEAKTSAIDGLKKDWAGEYEGNINKAMAFAEKNYSKETIEKYGNDPLFIKDTLNLYNSTSGDRIDNVSGEVKQTSDDLLTEARNLMVSPEYQNPMSPSHNTVNARVKDLYKRAAEMAA